MHIVFQFPFVDLRPFCSQGPRVSGPRVPGAAAEPNLPGSVVDSLSYFGWAEKRNRGADEAFPDESRFYSAHNALRFVGLGRRAFSQRNVEVEKRIFSKRRLFVSDKELTKGAAVRVEVGLDLNAGQSSLDFDSLVRLLRTVPALPTEIGTMPAFDLESLGSRELRKIVGKRALLRQGKALAAHFAVATSRWSEGDHHRAMKLVRPCQPPVILVELEDEDAMADDFGCKLPYFRYLDRKHTAGADVWFGQLRTMKRAKIPCWILAVGEASPSIVRRLRLCLLRLHAEHLVLEQTLRWFENEPESEVDLASLKDYFAYSWDKVVCRRRRAELGQSAIMEANAALAAIRPEDETSYLYLKRRLDRARRRIGGLIAAGAGPSRAEVHAPSPEPLPADWVYWLDELEPKPDLTVFIAADRHSSELAWGFSSPHGFLGLDRTAMEKPYCVDIGDSPGGFAESVRNVIYQSRNKDTLYPTARSVGDTIGAKTPPDLWRYLWTLHEKLGRIPTLMILSEEMYVPWELARDTDPEKSGKSFLAAESVVSRWMLPEGRWGDRWPVAEMGIGHAAFVAGEYGGADSWVEDLPMAREEVERIAEICARRNPGVKISRAEAEFQHIIECLEIDPPVGLLHFSLHGKFDPRFLRDGLLMNDGDPLNIFAVKSLRLDGHPFVFLNACEVGSGRTMLGDSGGYAEAFLHAGASAVVAPLWEVEDTVAKRVALEFYDQALCGNGSPSVAELLRRERGRFGRGAVSPTPIAYKFFGHPEFRVKLR